MRNAWMLILVGLVIGTIGGTFIGTTLAERANVAAGEAALLRADNALRAGKYEDALQFAYAAIDRNPMLYSAFELAGDAIAKQSRTDSIVQHYRRAYDLVGQSREGAVLRKLTESEVRAERDRLRTKIAAANGNP
jgi:tetratricopeptide (TPR) repeat protein